MNEGGKRNTDLSDCLTRRRGGAESINSDSPNSDVPWRRLCEFIERVERPNTDGKYSYDAVRGVSNTKEIQNTKANIEGRNLLPFHVIKKGEFVFNRRTTRNGERLGLGFNDSDETYLFTEDYVAFRSKDESQVLPGYLYLFFLRPEFDRYVRWDSWGSATEFFNWENMIQVSIPVPSIKVQRKVVEAWQGLRRMKEENERLAEPLMQLCRSYLQECKKKYPMTEIGPMIAPCDDRNRDGEYGVESVRGVSNENIFIETRANMDGVLLYNYKQIPVGGFAYNPSRLNIGSIAYNDSDETFIVSGIYETFKVKYPVQLLPDYLFLYFRRSEFLRYVAFNSWGSVRDSFSFADMCRVKIPLPPIEVQQAIVDVYRCANEAKKIAEEADRLSREICPALVRWAAEGGGA